MSANSINLITVRTGGKRSGWLYRSQGLLVRTYVISISELAVVDLLGDHDEHFSYLTSFITLFGGAYMVLIGLLFRCKYIYACKVNTRV